LPSESILQIKTNNLGRAAENSFTISNEMGEVFYAETSFSDDSTYNYVLKLEDGCYQFRFVDNMEDGISVHWWNRNSAPEEVGINGSIKFLSKDKKEIFNFKPDFGQELILNFRIGRLR